MTVLDLRVDPSPSRPVAEGSGVPGALWADVLPLSRRLEKRAAVGSNAERAPAGREPGSRAVAGSKRKRVRPGGTRHSKTDA